MLLTLASVSALAFAPPFFRVVRVPSVPGERLMGRKGPRVTGSPNQVPKVRQGDRLPGSPGDRLPG